jgi:hypothetical protein
MKLINHTKNNFYHLPDGTTIHGTITMTQQEWQKSYLWLWGQYQKAKLNIETYQRDSLSSLKNEQGSLFSIGVMATFLLVKHNKLPNHKDQNYAIKIK